MRNLFNMDNPFFRALGRVADLMILNITFLICCIPIVTIGAALTGMYYVTLKMSENEEGYIFKGFLKSFRQNFKQATVIWLILLVLGSLLGLDLYILSQMEGTVGTVLTVIITALAFLYVIELVYVFPTLARFFNSTKNTMKNAFIMSIADFPRTIVMLLITVGAVLVTLLNTYTIIYGSLIWILFGFALIALGNSYFLKKVFAKYIPKEEESEPDHWVLDESKEQN